MLGYSYKLIDLKQKTLILGDKVNKLFYSPYDSGGGFKRKPIAYNEEAEQIFWQIFETENVSDILKSLSLLLAKNVIVYQSVAIKIIAMYEESQEKKLLKNIKKGLFPINAEKI